MIPASLFKEIGEMIDVLLEKAHEEEETIWLVEESTGEGIKLLDYLNSEKRSIEKRFVIVED